MNPYNYALNVQSPIEAAVQGLKFGAMSADVQAAQQARDLQMAQQQQAIAQQKMVQDAMLGLVGKIKNGSINPNDFRVFSLIAPKEKSEAAMKIFESMDKSEKENVLAFSTQVMSALGSKNPQIGIDLLKQKAEGERNSGREDQAKAYDTWAQLAELDPAGSQAVIGGMLQGLPGGEKALEGWVKVQGERRAQERQPAEMTKLQAEAQKSAVAAKFAESEAVLDLQKKGWDITKVQEDIKVAKQNASIAALNAKLAKENNTIKRQELDIKLQEMKDKRDTSIREKTADVESARATMDNMLNTADRILKTPMSVIGSAAGPVSSRIPTVSQNTADLEALVETLGAQSFLAQIPSIKGMGALSNAEGEKLQAALQNLSLKQSPERLVENIKEAQRLILKGRSNLSKRYGVPDSVPDTPAVQTSPADIDALVKKYSGVK